MKLQMHSIHFDADRKLIDFIQRKADKLDTFHGRIIDGEVTMRLTKDETQENKLVELKIRIPGQQLFSREQAKSFEAATDMVVDAMKRQLTKHKAKIVAH
ncbi:ribosome-associated translation inhibitor RaiA [Rhodocytophaga aerolata]|jgi:putative sigma-54 modulation protein|uniref:Ribosome-associated translation inhibitor RaiA n=1 Tax=Rhodocytophaga aerolata TaxID=455078 RepID=A0ABT8QYJ1_9BACT|nr:ribosome-associated translation inhibitor RaiA [Rhodocytophaga aerolata]MDO1444907.1 ribosome-associated translation inhibitor RaiA [Rhodocytophaga aerolata]